jgi:putative addiction module antidote
MEAAMKLEVKKIGNSTGVILPKELLARLKLEKGDWLYVSETADGGVRLTPYDPTFEKGMQIAKKAMKTYRNALAELAK